MLSGTRPRDPTAPAEYWDSTDFFVSGWFVSLDVVFRDRPGCMEDSDSAFIALCGCHKEWRALK